MSTSTVDLQQDPHGHGDDGHGHDDPHHQHHFTTMEQQFDTSKIGMWLFLATEVLLFGGLFVGFGLMQARYPREFMEAHEHLQRPLGSLNTVVLLISSFTMVMGVLSAQNEPAEETGRISAADHLVRLHLPGRQIFRVFAQIRRRTAPRPLLFAPGRQDSDQRSFEPRLRDVLQLSIS